MVDKCMNNLCANCKHRQICKYVDEVSKIEKAVQQIKAPPIVKIEVNCFSTDYNNIVLRTINNEQISRH